MPDRDPSHVRQIQRPTPTTHERPTVKCPNIHLAILLEFPQDSPPDHAENRMIEILLSPVVDRPRSLFNRRGLNLSNSGCQRCLYFLDRYFQTADIRLVNTFDLRRNTLLLFPIL